MTSAPQVWVCSLSCGTVKKMSTFRVFFRDRCTSVNSFLESGRLLRHQLNYALTTCPPDMLLMAQLASRQNINGVQHSVRVDSRAPRCSAQHWKHTSREKTKICSVCQSRCHSGCLRPCAFGRLNHSAPLKLPFLPARQEPPWISNYDD